MEGGREEGRKVGRKNSLSVSGAPHPPKHFVTFAQCLSLLINSPPGTAWYAFILAGLSNPN